MYEKFKTKEYCFISDKLYFNNTYYVKKTVLSTYLYVPFFKQVIRFESHFGDLIEKEEYKRLYEEKSEKEISSKFTCYQVNLEKLKQEDLKFELEKYCPIPKKRDFYFFKRAFHKNKLLPAYITLSDELLGATNSRQIFSLNKQNQAYYITEVRNIIQNYTVWHYPVILGRKTLSEYIDYIGILSKIAENLIFKKEELIIDHIRQFDKRLKSYNEPFLTNYFQEILDSILLSIKNGIARCEHCENIMKYAENKKYCSLKTDGRDCGKSARNKRTYKRSKLKKSSTNNRTTEK